MATLIRMLGRCRAIFVVLVLLCPLQPQEAHGQTSLDIYAPFDPAVFSFDELRLLQLALAFKGDYNGLLDGDWGWMSQRAMRSFSRREIGEPSAIWHAAMLLGGFLQEFEGSGWDSIYLPDFGVSIIFPTAAYREEPSSGAFRNWRHLRSSLRISAAQTNSSGMQETHRYILRNAARGTEPYTVRGQDRFVTRVFDGTDFIYARSERISGLWSTVVVAVSRRDEPILDAVASGITAGRDRPLILPEGGNLRRIFQAVLEVLNDMHGAGPPSFSGPSTVITPDTGTGTSGQGRSPHEPPLSMSSGTAFMLNGDGYLLTNEHVVNGCRRVTVSGRASHVIAASEQFDLAILLAPDLAGRPALSLAPNPATLNENIVAAGFPLVDVLGGLNVTQGSVTSMTGMGGDGIHFQMSAPIQPGSSGGPVVDEFGNVVGVVVAFLGADMRDAERPNIPQNVNFAVRAEIARLLFLQNNVGFTVGEEFEPLRPVELGALVQETTHFVQCER